MFSKHSPTIIKLCFTIEGGDFFVDNKAFKQLTILEIQISPLFYSGFYYSIFSFLCTVC